MSQRLGHCSTCPDNRVRWVYRAANPDTDRLEWVCAKHLDEWQRQYEAPTPQADSRRGPARAGVVE